MTIYYQVRDGEIVRHELGDGKLYSTREEAEEFLAFSTALREWQEQQEQEQASA